jgi:SpoVK/Ycf46/Vps4 family AAA+-type ATPase
MGSSETATMIGATNALQSIDAALLRPGRFDFLVEVPLPDEMGREEILRIHAAEAEERAGRELFAHVNYAGIAVAMEGYSGADIAEIIKRALRWKVKEVREGNAAESVGTADVMRQVKMYERESATL